ncbi:MAG: PAS domain-containing protein [Candidatus Omnitrophica bacterium]|nr:PAS domain-containing protein [Candidatus Omnitrophota bacterium]
MRDLSSATFLLSSLHDPIIELDRDGVILWANPAAELLLGDGTPLADEFLVSFVARSRDGEELLSELGKVEEGEFICDLDMKNRDGFEIPVEMSLFKETHWPTFLVVLHPGSDEAHSTERLAVQALHLTTRLSAVQQKVHELSAELLDKTIQLSEAKNRMEAVLASMGEGLLVIDSLGVVAQINQSACRILEIEAGQITGKNIEESSPGTKPFLLARHLTRRETPQPGERIEPQRIDLQEKVVEVSIAPIQEREGLSGEGGIVMNLRDVTRQAELDRLKTDLISIVSHEIRSPLSNMMGYIDLVLSDPSHTLPEENAEFLQVAHRNGARLAHLVDDMLDLSRLDAGKIEMDITAVDLEYLINFSLLSFRNEADSKKITLSKEVQGHPQAAGDNDRLQQVLNNLLSNAIKYTREGGEVAVSAVEAGETVSLSVADTGIGLKPEDLARLFQRFFRVRNEDTRKISGTGLGLSISKSIVDAHGGRLTVTSEYGKGTTFTVILPTWRT